VKHDENTCSFVRRQRNAPRHARTRPAVSGGIWNTVGASGVVPDTPGTLDDLHAHESLRALRQTGSCGARYDGATPRRVAGRSGSRSHPRKPQAPSSVPDAAAALDTLRRTGVLVAALTNGTSAGVRTQLRHAGLFEKFDDVISVDQVKVYKPGRTPYLFAARRFRAKVDRLSLIAAHHWDLAGAKAAGLTTVFVRRPGAVLSPLGPKPDIEVADLEEFARRVATRRHRAR